ncbi:Mediator of RNA polymerase II transcription subunit 8 [Blattella germanica]|nr:Mediator of RNA polymerase II transcription subunit 8 [Blattella germanica]
MNENDLFAADTVFKNIKKIMYPMYNLSIRDNITSYLSSLTSVRWRYLTLTPGAQKFKLPTLDNASLFLTLDSDLARNRSALFLRHGYMWSMDNIIISPKSKNKQMNGSLELQKKVILKILDGMPRVRSFSDMSYHCHRSIVFSDQEGKIELIFNNVQTQPALMKMTFGDSRNCEDFLSPMYIVYVYIFFMYLFVFLMMLKLLNNIQVHKDFEDPNKPYLTANLLTFIIHQTMQREEKQLDASLEAIIIRVNDLKNSIGSMLVKLEHEYETLNWPTFLDNFALMSGHLTSLSKLLSHDKSPPLRNLTVLPLLLSPDRDEELLRLTEGRVPTFSHDLVPDYLRTKPEPDKQVTAYSKVVNHVWDIVSKAREEWETETGSRSGAAQTSSMSDTHTLVAAVGMGKGLKPMQQPVPSGPQSMMVAPVGRPGAGPQQPGAGPMNPNQPGQMGPMGKAPSAIKTNIKAASQIHPYGR